MSTLANAKDVLKLIARLRRDVTVTDVMNELQHPKSSASRTLSMMANYGFLERDPATRAYRPGPVVMEASYHFRGSHNVASLVEEALDALVRETGHTGYILLLDGAEAMVIDMRPGSGTLQVYTPTGSRAPAYASSQGRALLARLDDREVLALVGPRLEVRRGNSPKTPKELLARLAQVRAQGWAFSSNEFVENVAGVAAAVMDPSTHKYYGFGLAFPADQASDALAAKLGSRVRDAAREVGKRVGDTYWLEFK
jgi:DNA-binding IclR family transcriptional regulator